MSNIVVQDLLLHEQEYISTLEKNIYRLHEVSFFGN